MQMLLRALGQQDQLPYAPCASVRAWWSPGDACARAYGAPYCSSGPCSARWLQLVLDQHSEAEEAEKVWW